MYLIYEAELVYGEEGKEDRFRAGTLFESEVMEGRISRKEEEKLEKEYLKVREVAEFLRIGRTRAYELVGSGEIPSVRIGRSVRVSRKELERWLEAHRQSETWGG